MILTRVESNLILLTDRLPPEGKEDPQLNEAAMSLNEFTKDINICKKEATLTDKEFSKSEQKLTLKQFLEYCENSNNEELKLYRRALIDKQSKKCSNEIQHLRNVAKSVNLSYKRKLMLPLPKPRNYSQEFITNLNNQTDNALLKELKHNGLKENVNIKHATGLTHSDEEIKKVFKCRLCHNSEQAKSCWLLLSSSSICIRLRGCHTDAPISKYLYANIDLVVYDSSFHWFALVGTVEWQTGGQFTQIYVGDGDTTKSIMTYIDLYARRFLASIRPHRSISLKASNQGRTFSQKNSRIASLLPSFRQSVVEIVAVRNWMVALGRLKTDEELQKDWLVLWQDGTFQEEGSNPMTFTMEGHLMTRKQGFLSSWKPAYFLLKGGYLYEFFDASDQLPSQIVDMKTCRGCMKLPKSSRPHSLQILRRKESPILIAAPDEYMVEQWLEALLFVICSKQVNNIEKKEESDMVSCQLILTQSRLLLLQHNFETLLEHSVLSGNRMGGTSKVVDKYPEKPLDSKGVKHVSARHPCLLPRQYPSIGVGCFTPTSKLPRRKTSTPDGASAMSPTTDITSVGTPTPNANLAKKTGSCDNDYFSATVPTSTTDLSALEIPPEHHRPSTPAVCYNEVDLECKRNGKVLSSGNVDQVSCVFLIGDCATSCLVEFECSEAIEMIGDWVVHFRTEKELCDFVESIKEYNIQVENMCDTECSKRRDYFIKRSEQAQVEWISS